MHRSHWKIWFDANRPQGAEKVLGQVLEVLDIEGLQTTIEPYKKGGHVARFTVLHDADSWSELVVSVIALGERLGSGWQLFGSVAEDPSGWLTKDSGNLRISGVTNAEWSLMRAETD